MFEKNYQKNSNIYLKPNYFNLSSWNYGSYSPLNPCYKTYTNFPIKISKINNKTSSTIKMNLLRTKTNPQITKSNRIVTNDLLQNYNFEKKMNKFLSLGTFNAKNMNKTMNPKMTDKSTYKPKNKKIKKIKTDISEYKYKLSFNEWLNIKNKQIEYFNKIIKKSEKEDKIREEENKKIDIKYNMVKEQKFKEWCDKKNIENILKKKIKCRIKALKEEENKKKAERKQEIMDKWFKTQAEKMEKELITKRKQKKEQKEKQKEEIKLMREKRIKEREAFQKWREGKEKEKKIKIKEEKLKQKKEKEKNKKEYIKKKVKSFIIGPYTGASELRQALYNILETNLNKDENCSY